ncbi:MAG: aminoglycoside phosphotransferase family protein [Defluviitaleaceae bacterium]|nr:aminoglycoside phosphotransferase family protein [Defluviitaleaceae bacterium]
MDHQMLAQIRESAINGITKYLGNEKTNEFILKAEARLEKYAKLWQLSQLCFMPTETVNLLFECESALYGACVLKLCIPGPEVATEINCLRAYDGHGYVKLWDYTLEDDLLLLERVTPGQQMWAVNDYKERAWLMAHRIKDLHFIHCEQGKYPTYHIWLTDIHKKLTAMGNMDDMLIYLNKALHIYDELKQKYKRSCLLHGDMHQENMLLNSHGSYTIIDPKGVVDDPVMETARFLMNEVSCDIEKMRAIQEMVSIMSPIIGIPEADIFKSMYIDAALGQSWTFDEHFPNQQAYEQSKKEALGICEFVHGFL